MALVPFASLGKRFGYDERCKDLAAGIGRLGSSEVFLEVELQRILSGEVEPWVELVN